LPSSVVIRVANAPSAARAVVASDVIKVVFASSASPARVTSAAKLLVNNNSAARAVVASVLIAVVLEVTVVTMLPSADWNAATISVNESNAAPSVFS
jgi:type IV secretory pathway component VirB8